MTKNQKIEMLSSEVKALQQKLDIFTKAGNNSTNDIKSTYDEKISVLIKELEYEKMQYQDLRQELERTKKNYEELYARQLKFLKPGIFKFIHKIKYMFIKH
ncbi:MAG: hypothetical protein HFH68_00150 [Lachnospiraceae bacterium]|nr:hypothetical protein [Lachnospiraceae bacterium]